MPRFLKKSPKKAGSAPGTLVHIGEQKTDKPRISIIEYTENEIRNQVVEHIEDTFPARDSAPTSWINIDGIHDISLMETIGSHFGIHPLTLEDIVNTGHQPKAEDFDTHIYMVLKMLQYSDEDQMITAEQVSLIVGPTYLLSFQESSGDVFAPVRERLSKGHKRIRLRGSDYLAYALIDAVVDHYFHIMERIGEHAEDLDEQLTADAESGMIAVIHTLKREVIYLRKQIWPMREMLNRITKGDFELIEDENLLFWRDVYDHIVQLIDTTESYRDVLSGMLDHHLSTVSHRMNQVMKVLTIVATIFIPITFIAGIYGMNFKNMPELEWPWGYGMAWGVILTVVVVMLILFKNKKWL